MGVLIRGLVPVGPIMKHIAINQISAQDGARSPGLRCDAPIAVIGSIVEHLDVGARH